MARRFLISFDDLAQVVDKYAIAVGGVVKHIINASVADAGTVRQYWPPGEGDNVKDPRILWDTDPILVNQSVLDPLDSSAIIQFIQTSGRYQYSNYPSADMSGRFLSPPLDGTAGDNGLYLIRCSQTGGDALTGTLGTWLDLNLANYNFALDQTIVGVLNATADITIAKDNGSGSPESGTEVVKPCTFKSEVRDNDGWNPATPWALEHIVEGGDAFCTMTFYPTTMFPDGIAEGRGDTSGTFTENWLDTGGDPTGMTVNCTLISGTPPNLGEALGVDLALDAGVSRQWVLTTLAPGDDFSCTLLYTVKDGAVSYAKQVTMHSQYITSPANVAWSTTQWLLEDLIGSRATEAKITLGIDGIGLGNESVPTSNKYTENWHGDAPTPADLSSYEAKLTVLNGISGLITGSAVDVWVNLGSGAEWIFALNAGTYLEWGTDVSVRFIGQPEVTKRVIVTLGEEDITLPPGGELP